MTTINNKQIQRERLKCIRANCDNHKEVLELIQKVMDALWDLGMKTNPNGDGSHPYRCVQQRIYQIRKDMGGVRDSLEYEGLQPLLRKEND